MSTNVPETEQKTTTKPKLKTIQMEPFKRETFTRSPSIEKIIKFNTYICSQNYYILPALLAWLRTSQTVLHSYVERCIFLVKSLVYAIVHKIANPSQVLKALKTSTFRLYESVQTKQTKRAALTAFVYASFFLIYFQLSACVVTLLYVVPLPGGLVFLLVAITWISYINYHCLRLILTQHALKYSENKCETITQKYIRPKDILGKRTISNLNLF